MNHTPQTSPTDAPDLDRLARRRVGARLGWLETAIDDQANAANALDIARSGSRVAIRVIPTNEEWMIAHHTQVLISHH